jgi:hypothetical protein
MKVTLKIYNDFITLVKKTATVVFDFITLLALNKVIKFKKWSFIHGY